jgi:uncharacterized membrane protein YhaH (DUF805 family)
MPTTVGFWEHFRRLFDFKGREDRASFWPYAAVAFVIIIVIGMTIFLPMIDRSMEAMQQYAAQHPDQASATSGPGSYSISVHGNHPEFFPIGPMALYLGVSFGLAILLYAAAVVRRLHDRNKSGAWGLMPLPFIIYSSIMFGSFGTGSQPDMSLFFSIFFSNMLYVITLIALIVLLAGASDPEPNKYDAEV